MVYEVSEIKAILNQIDNHDIEAIKYWIEQMKNCIYTMNEEEYNKLIFNT
jgi:hypothetical protein